MQFECKKFDDLTPKQFYEIIHLRNEVFVVEQNCVFQDADHKDEDAYHFMLWNDNELAGYTRLLAPGLAYEQMSIGRVVTSPKYRRKGIGKQLMEESIKACYRSFGQGSIKIGAQLYLKKFYESFDFLQVGEQYIEDGIPHIYMIKD
jgi:ElaA protein